MVKVGISRKITLRPEELQGLVHLMLSTSSASDTIVTAITSSEIAVVEKLLDDRKSFMMRDPTVLPSRCSKPDYTILKKESKDRV